MTRPTLIALTGPAGCGKTTVAKALEDRGFVRVRFAGPLKAALRAIGLTEAQVDGDQKEVPCDLLCGKTPRHAMQTIGLEWGRDMIGGDLWVNAAMAKIDEALAAGRDVVVDDLRFDNEAESLSKRGAAIFKLVRFTETAAADHASEAGIALEWLTAIGSNEGTVEDMVRWIEYMVSRRSRRAW